MLGCNAGKKSKIVFQTMHAEEMVGHIDDKMQVSRGLARRCALMENPYCSCKLMTRVRSPMTGAGRRRLATPGTRRRTTSPCTAGYVIALPLRPCLTSGCT